MIIGDRYFIDNPESGYYEVDKEYHEAYHKRYQEFLNAFIHPNVDMLKRRVGKVIITSTVADEGGENDFKKL